MSQAIQNAARLHRQGKLDEAEVLYAAILAAEPDHFDALNMLGVLRFQQGQDAEALRYMRAALNLKPNAAVVMASIGLVLARLNEPEQALASYDKALALKPDDAELLNNRGNALKALGRLDEALASYDRAIALKPDFAQAHNNRGVALHALRRTAEALVSYDKALALKPDDPEIHNNRGAVLAKLKRFDEALTSYDRALALAPNFADAINNRGVVFKELRQFDAALASYDKALAIAPDFAEAFVNRGNALKELERFDEALASYDRALTLKPDFAEAHNNRGNLLQDMQRLGEALASYDRAVAIRPSYAEARHGKSLCLLLRGDFARGWREYESRWDTEQMETGRRNFAQFLWLGEEDVGGMTILLHGEQGFGDTIQFCRLAKLVAQRGAKVVLEVQPALKSLIASLDRSIPVISTGDVLPQLDAHCPLMSLPLALNMTVATIPADRAYLAAPEAKITQWRDRLGAHRAHRIGLVWAGNPRPDAFDANRIDRQRSLAFDALAPWLEVENCAFYSLQKGSEAAAQLRRSAFAGRVVDWTDDLVDFDDTAALIANLDLVIAVDTAVAHLAGAIGKPFWLLNRFNTCWRWLLDREDSPWYPTARIFRQTTLGEWEPVVERVADELRTWKVARRAM